MLLLVLLLLFAVCFFNICHQLLLRMALSLAHGEVLWTVGEVC